MKNSAYKKGIFLAIAAAAFYAVNSPLSKILFDYMPSTLMAGFLYVGAGIGMLLTTNRFLTEEKENSTRIPAIIAIKKLK